MTHMKSFHGYLITSLLMGAFFPGSIFAQITQTVESGSALERLRQDEQFLTLTPGEQRIVEQSIAGNLDESGTIKRVQSLGSEPCPQSIRLRSRHDSSKQASVMALSLSGYPLVPDSDTVVIACVQSSGFEQLEDVELTMKITDGNGKILREAVYRGGVVALPMAVKESFSSPNDVDVIMVRAELRKDDMLLDVREETYRCPEGGDYCANGMKPYGSESFFRTIVLPIAMGIVVVIAAVVSIIVFRKRRILPQLVFFFVLFLTIGVPGVKAASCTTTPATPTALPCNTCTADSTEVSWLGEGCTYVSSCCGNCCIYPDGCINSGYIVIGYAYTSCSCPVGQTGSIFTYYFGSDPYIYNTCSATAAVNGSCGSANGTIVASVPTTNLCSAGTASAVSGSGPWTWTCAGSNGGATASCSAALAGPVSTLRLCQDGIYYAKGGEAGISVSLYQGNTRSLTAYYDTGTDCSGASVAASTSFVPSSSAISVSGSDPRTLLGADVPGVSASGQQSAASILSVTHAGQTVTMPVTVIENCSSNCASEAVSRCQGEEFTADDSCGVPRTCYGSRSCDMNWKEVVPGL